MKKSVLKCEHLCKTYYSDEVEFNALKNVSLEINEGEFVAIMGQSGSGKSTLLYTLSGMDSITSGEVFVNGRQINEAKPKEMTKIRRENIGFVFQGINLVSNLSLFENIVVPGYLTKVSRKEIDSRAKKLFTKMDLDQQVNKLPSQVSGGQKQRAAIARSLINQPNILFADEPTGALNSSSGKAVLELMSEFNKEGQTIVMVTHDIKSASYANRVIFLHDGRIDGELNLEKYKMTNQTEQEQTIFNFLSKKGW